MTYNQAWDETIPLDASLASLLGVDIRDDKIAVGERMVSLGCTGWRTDDPVSFSFAQLGGLHPYFIGDSTSLDISFISRDGINQNFVVYDNGSAAFRGQVGFNSGLIVVGTGQIQNLLVTGTTELEGAVTCDTTLVVTGIATFNNSVIINHNSVVQTGVSISFGATVSFSSSTLLMTNGSTINAVNALQVSPGTTPTGGLVGFYGTSPINRQVLATGAGHTVDDVITKLQAYGLVSQS